MIEKIFRGFYPDENGTRNITIDGKKITGEWIYGSLIELGDRKYICFADECHNIMDVGVLSFEVIPETVRQYIGWLDKNKNKIFENDIISYGNSIGVIKWAEQHCAFMSVEERGVI